MQGAVHGNAEALFHSSASGCLQTQLRLQPRKLYFTDTKFTEVGCKVMVRFERILSRLPKDPLPLGRGKRKLPVGHSRSIEFALGRIVLNEDDRLASLSCAEDAIGYSTEQFVGPRHWPITKEHANLNIDHKQGFTHIDEFATRKTNSLPSNCPLDSRRLLCFAFLSEEAQVTRAYSATRPPEYPAKPAPRRLRDFDAGALPPGPRKFPGQLTVEFSLDTPGFLLDLHRKYGDAASFSLAGELFIAVFNPEAVVDVLVKKQHSFIKGVGFERMHKVLGKGLLTNEEPVHLRHRRMMQPPFHHQKLDEYAQKMQRVVRDHIGRWEVGSQVEAAEEMMELTFQIVAQILFSTEIGEFAKGVQHHMGIAIDRIERTMLPGFDRYDEWPVPYFRKFKDSSNYLSEVAEEIIGRRLASGEIGEDLLGLLIQARDEDDSQLSADDVRDETLTLILSGHETTANVTTWAMAYLRDREDLWDVLAAEASEYLPENEFPQLRRILSAPIANSVFAEALRLAPPVWVAPRRALEDVEVGGTAIPKGAHVLVSQFASHRSEKYFEDPDAFKPERWADEFESKLPRGAYFPFGAGTRKCLGDQFALLEANIILLEMARSKRLKPVAAGLPKAEPRATYRPKGTVPAKVIAKSKNEKYAPRDSNPEPAD